MSICILHRNTMVSNGVNRRNCTGKPVCTRHCFSPRRPTIQNNGLPRGTPKGHGGAYNPWRHYCQCPPLPKRHLSQFIANVYIFKSRIHHMADPSHKTHVDGPTAGGSLRRTKQKSATGEHYDHWT